MEQKPIAHKSVARSCILFHVIWKQNCLKRARKAKDRETGDREREEMKNVLYKNNNMSSCSFYFSSPSEYDLHPYMNASTRIYMCLYLVSKTVSDDAIERKFMRVYNDNDCTATTAGKKYG